MRSATTATGWPSTTTWPSVGSTNPPVLIALLAANTERIRIGSGGVMLPNHAPLIVAEQFALLEAYAPGRIDLGIGRAPGSDQVVSAVLARRTTGSVDDFPNNVSRDRRDDVAGRCAGPARRRPRRTTSRPRRPPRTMPDDLAARLVRLLGVAGRSARPAVRVRLALLRRRAVPRRALDLYRSRFTAVREAGRAEDPGDRERRGGTDDRGGPRRSRCRSCSGWRSCAAGGRWRHWQRFRKPPRHRPRRARIS